MTDLFLIAHIVRGQPAFDIAEHLTCPECLGHGCSECDEEGFWWVVGTSGHRAYPYYSIPFDELSAGDTIDGYYSITSLAPSEAPPSWPDHYNVRSAPSAKPGQFLIAALGLDLRQPSAPIKRRV